MSQGTIPLPEPFNLALTLLCGQAFRWEGPDALGWFEGVAGQAAWRLKQEGMVLHWACGEDQARGIPPGEWLHSYLRLGDDLDGWAGGFGPEAVTRESLRVLRGLRLLDQEPWECTVSFMFAQGLSVSVISKALGRLCAQFGRPLPAPPGAAPGRVFHGFPQVPDLGRLSADQLRPYTNNYRARADRVIRLARAVDAQVISLEHLKAIPCDEAREALMALDGIGPKIADCILLFSLDQLSAFPVDRWILRAMRRHFGFIRALRAKQEAPTLLQYGKLVKAARKRFGTRCGVASEYLFLFLRILEDSKLRSQLSPHCCPFDSAWISQPPRGFKRVKRLTRPRGRPLASKS